MFMWTIAFTYSHVIYLSLLDNFGSWVPNLPVSRKTHTHPVSDGIRINNHQTKKQSLNLEMWLGNLDIWSWGLSTKLESFNYVTYVTSTMTTEVLDDKVYHLPVHQETFILWLHSGDLDHSVCSISISMSVYVCILCYWIQRFTDRFALTGQEKFKIHSEERDL